MIWQKLLISFILVFAPFYAFAGAWEQAQELCKQSGGNCNYNIPTPTPSIDTQVQQKSIPQSKPKSYSHSSTSLSPSQSMAIGIFSSLFSGFLGGLTNLPDSTDYSNAQLQKQKEYEQQQKLLMKQKQQTLKKWHAIVDNQTTVTQTTANNIENNSAGLGFKTLGSSLQPFKWDNENKMQYLNKDSIAQIQSNEIFDFNHEAEQFIENRFENVIEEGGKNFLEKYAQSKLTLAKTLKQQKQIKQLNEKILSDKTFENTFGIANIVVNYKQGGIIQATLSTADFLISKIGIPQATMTLEAGRVYSRFVFNLLDNDLTNISDAISQLTNTQNTFNFNDFIKENFDSKQIAIKKWLGGQV